MAIQFNFTHHFTQKREHTYLPVSYRLHLLLYLNNSAKNEFIVIYNFSHEHDRLLFFSRVHSNYGPPTNLGKIIFQGWSIQKWFLKRLCPGAHSPERHA